jgi:hypothetical protein
MSNKQRELIENRIYNKYRVYYINIKNLRGYDEMIPVSAENTEDAKDKVLKFLKSTQKVQDIVITKVEEE